ncbi:MAG: hypothetical protein QNK20_16175 [Aureibaculum sp.]|nr:hypothetical protein [Aureibaculum sp.]
MKCKICKKELKGRQDKIFCSIECKNYYHTNLRRVTNETARALDTILHRNRSILLELLGKNANQKKVKRLVLAKKKFNFKYITHFNINSKGKIYHHVYDFSWMEFSDDEILILRRR